MKTRGYALRVDISASAPTVWSALTEEVHLVRWMNPDARIKPRAGGSLYAMPAPGLARDGLIDVFDANRRLRVIYLPPEELAEFDGAVVDDYLVEAEGSHSIVRLLGSGFPEMEGWNEHYRRVRMAQERALARLKVMAERLQGER